MLLRALKLFAEDGGRTHAMYCLEEEDVVFYAGERQVGGEGKAQK